MAEFKTFKVLSQFFTAKTTSPPQLAPATTVPCLLLQRLEGRGVVNWLQELTQQRHLREALQLCAALDEASVHLVVPDVLGHGHLKEAGDDAGRLEVVLEGRGVPSVS